MTTQGIRMKKNEKNTGKVRLHFSKEMLLTIVTCVVALVAMLPVSEVLTDMLLCAMDIPDEDWRVLKALSHIFVVLIAAALGVIAYSRATDED